MRTHGGERSGAGRPRADSPLGYLQVLDDPASTSDQKSRAAEGLARARWTRAIRKQFLRATGADYVALREKTSTRMWDALLPALPKMAETGDWGRAWLAYKLILSRRHASLRPSPDVAAKLNELLPQAARALWRISLTNDPKDPLYKSTPFLRVRRKARAALCREIGMLVTKELLDVPANGFMRLLFETVASARMTLTPKQAVVLAAWAEREVGMDFLQRGVRLGIIRIAEAARS